MEKELPKNWIILPLEKLGENKYYSIGDGDHGQIKPSDYKESGVPYIRVGDLDWGFFKEEKLVYISEEVHSKNLKSELLPGDILIAKTGATIGKCCIVPNHIKKANTTSSVGKVSINKDLTSSKWILYYFLSPDFFKLMWSHSHRTAQPGFNIIDLKNFPIPLPPLAEQNRIVAKLDALFAQLETIKTSMAKVPLLLKDFRQQVLTQAVTGKLTEEWRKVRELEDISVFEKKVYDYKYNAYENELKKWKEKSSDKNYKNRLIKPSKPKVLPIVEDWENENNFEIPKEWKFVRFNDVTNKIGDIDHKMPKDYPNGIPYLSTGNMKDVNNLDFENAKTISKEDYEVLAAKIKPENGDIIFPRYGTIGRNILIDFDKEFLVSYSCAIIKNFNELMIPKYIYFVSISQFIKYEISKHVVQTTQANIGIASIEKFLFPLCTTQEQQEIVSRVESLFAKAEAIEKQYESLKAKIDTLPQAILHKAFKGELTEQLDSDGDARELLREIEGLKAMSGKVSKKQKVKV